MHYMYNHSSHREMPAYTDAGLCMRILIARQLTINFDH